MAKTVRAILGDIYDAWRAQNLDWMATYLPDDFCHVIHIPVDLHPLGGTRRGKKEALERLQLIVEQFDFVVFDTSDLMIKRTAPPSRYRSTIATARPGPRSNRPRRISGRSKTAGR
jgi:hypothetical protein